MIDEDLIYIQIGKRIKNKRLIAGKSQVELAAGIEVSRASLANYESGNTAIYISDLYHIAEYLGKNIHDFLPTIDEIKAQTLPEKLLNKLDEYKKQEILEFLSKLEKKERRNE